MRERQAAGANLRGPLFRRLRLGEPWQHKAPFLVSIPYFLLLAGWASFREAMVGMLWALCTIVGIAGFGYLTNDLADRDADRRADRPNAAADLSRSQTALLFAGFLAAAIAPWILYFPVDGISLRLLAAEFVLLLAYSFPPLRLKERGIAGLGSDALYAHVVPALLAAYTFHALTDRVYERFPEFLAALGSWQFFLGLRNILTHQLADVGHDRAAGTATYVTRVGEEAAMRLLKFVLVPLELATFGAFTAVTAMTTPVLAAAWPVYAAAIALLIRSHWNQPLRAALRERLHRFLNEYYLGWMPLAVLLPLCIRDPRMTVLLLLHVAIFPNGLTPVLVGAWRTLRSARGESAPGIATTD